MGMPPPALLAADGTRERVVEAVERLRGTLPPLHASREPARAIMVLSSVSFDEASARWATEAPPHSQDAQLDDEDLTFGLRTALGTPDQPLVPGLTRFGLYRAILRHGIPRASADALDWLAEETGALTRLRDDLAPGLRRALVEEARRRLEGALASDGGAMACARLLTSAHLPDEVPASLARELDVRCERGALRRALARTPERLCAKAMFEACLSRAQLTHHSQRPRAVRVELHRDVLRELTGDDARQLVDPAMTRLCGAFSDVEQGAGFYVAVRAHVCRAWPGPFAFERRLRDAFRAQPGDAGDALCAALRALGLRDADVPDYLEKLSLTMPAWASHFAERETTRPGALLDFLAVLVTLEHAALVSLSERSGSDVTQLLDALPPRPLSGEHPRELAFRMFHAAQLTGLSLAAILAWSREQASAFALAVQGFDAASCRRALREAHDHRERQATLAGHTSRSRTTMLVGRSPARNRLPGAIDAVEYDATRDPEGDELARIVAERLPERLVDALDAMLAGRAVSRPLVIVECEPDVLGASLAQHRELEAAARGGWLRLVTLDPADGGAHDFEVGTFGPQRSGFDSARTRHRRRPATAFTRLRLDLWKRALVDPLVALAERLERAEGRVRTLLAGSRARPSLQPSTRTLRPSQRAERP